MPPIQSLPTPTLLSRGLLGIEPDQLNYFMASKPLHFLVGHDRAEFSIHSSLVSRLSAALNALANGGTKGSFKGYIACEDIGEDIFSRFVQFVYTGAYTGFAPTEKYGPTVMASVDEMVPDISPDGPLHIGSTNVAIQEGNVKAGFGSTSLFGPLPRNDENDAFILPFSLASYQRAAAQQTTGWFGSPQYSALWNQHQPGSRSKHESGTAACDYRPFQRKLDLISAFMEKRFDLAGPSKYYDSSNTGQAKPDPRTMSFEHVFIGHARIWFFAYRFAIASLMDLACSQLAHGLAQWTISPSAFVPEFGGLVRYVYGGHTNGGCQLRRLVAEFAICVVKDVNGLEGWSMLLKEVPAFAADLVNMMADRVG